jgi:hypothetical protein
MKKNRTMQSYMNKELLNRSRERQASSTGVIGLVTLRSKGSDRMGMAASSRLAKKRNQTVIPPSRRTLLARNSSNAKRSTPRVEPQRERPFYKTATPEEWSRALREWSDSHDRNTPLLSDEAVSRKGIYEED